VDAGDLVQATHWGDEALALHQQLGDAWGIANSIFILGHLAAYRRDGVIARALFEQSLEAFHSLGDEHYSLLVAGQLAWVHEELGDMDRGRALTEDNLERARALGNERMEALALQGLAFHAQEEGRFEEALSMISDAYRIHRDLGQRGEIADTISRFARVHAGAERPLSAVRLLSSSDAHYEDLGTTPPSWVAHRNEITLAIVRAQLDEAAFTESWEEGRTLTADEAVALALNSVE
jgi:tetratricopeptide (TPR) repeat protein